MTTRIKVYTDGSCVNKVGGYGYVYMNGELSITESGRVPINPCTNQKAELYAILHALDNLDFDRIDIYSDSMYSIKSVTEWIYRWKENGWKTAKGKPVLNQDLIKSIDYLLCNKDVEFYHVKAHNGDVLNECADLLANAGRLKN